ncbi:MAG TPA: alpha/beta hydrolase [Arachnia sp.]|nr:alpha/beta hydrolase [Arachnia sp.]HMT86092.1 alpha/beta hydrolase [Arachnia sp.]
MPTDTAPTFRTYAALLPEARREAAAVAPESTWWQWRGHDVHVARAHRPKAPVRVLVVHGAGAHSAALWPLAALLAERGVDVAAVDLPLYGRTTSPDPSAVRYDDWVELLGEFVASDQDDRPLILLGASIGGLLACEVAARSPRVDGVAATSLLDPSDWRVQMHLTRYGPLGLLGAPLSLLVRGGLAGVMVPMRWVANLKRMSHDPRLSRLCATDPRGGGARIPLGFLASYLRYRHTPPERMPTPLTLLHPSRDEWTPVELSMRFLQRMTAPANVVLLRECGHFPIEEPGITDLLDAISDLADGLQPAKDDRRSA